MLKEARHLARADYIAMPWRNGAGITHEIAREPAQGEDFSWRMSLASLQMNGPFSSYAGYRRCVALVEGHGFRLHIAGVSAELRTRGSHILFDGAADTRCELVDGPCTDLSLIVRAPGLIDYVRELAIDGQEELKSPAARTLALFVLRGAVSAQTSGRSARAHERAAFFRLNLHDTLLLPGEQSWSIKSTTIEPAELLGLCFAVPWSACAPLTTGESQPHRR